MQVKNDEADNKKQIRNCKEQRYSTEAEAKAVYDNLPEKDAKILCYRGGVKDRAGHDLITNLMTQKAKE